MEAKITSSKYTPNGREVTFRIKLKNQQEIDNLWKFLVHTKFSDVSKILGIKHTEAQTFIKTLSDPLEKKITEELQP